MFVWRLFSRKKEKKEIPGSEEEVNMFKRIVIELVGPICMCPIQDLSWSIWIANGDQPCLKIMCETCGVELLVPRKVFVGRFVLDNPYPGTKSSVKVEQPKEKKEPNIEKGMANVSLEKRN